MIKVNKEFRILSGILVLSLLLFPVLGFGSNGFTAEDRDQAMGILNEKYSELPGMEFEFSETAATFEDVTFSPYSKLAISLPNLTDGIVVGLVSYGDKPYLLMATKLPEGVDADHGAGLIDLSAGEAVFVAEADISRQDENVDKAEFGLSPVGEDSSNLEMVINGEMFVVKTKIPKSL